MRTMKIFTLKISSRGGETHGNAQIAVGRLTETRKMDINNSGTCHGFNRDLGLSWISLTQKKRGEGIRKRDKN